MPRTQPTESWQKLRNYVEKWQWTDPKHRVKTTGYVAPEGAVDKERVPVDICYITKRGVVEHGRVVCLKVNRHNHQRMVQFVESKEIRWVNDILVISVDGVRFK